MSTNKSASIETQLKNTKELLSSINEFSLYNPSINEIKPETYKEFYESAESTMHSYNDAKGAVSNAIRENRDIFAELLKTARSIRSEIGEIAGIKSSVYEQANHYVKLITGQNVTDYSKKKPVPPENPEAGSGGIKFNSVSQTDMRSRLGNFRLLISLLRNYESYNPADEFLKIESLENLRERIEASISKMSEKSAILTSERSRIEHIFRGRMGLRDRARRAKLHIRRKYGKNSPEYRSIVNKRY